MRRCLSCASVLVVVYFLAAACLATSTPIANLTTDQTALLAFRAHVAPNDVLAHNWSAATSCCSWFGVTCGLRHRRVTALDLGNMSLSGTIPPHLGNLSFLASLDLSDNSFHGHLPHELGSLHRMKVIDLTMNNLTGELPLWLGNLTKLQILSLSINSFTGRISRGIGNLTMLKELYLGLNNLEEYGPGGIIFLSDDVYNFGILMMETFTRKKPIDEMFIGEIILKLWEKDSYLML